MTLLSVCSSSWRFSWVIEYTVTEKIVHFQNSLFASGKTYFASSSIVFSFFSRASLASSALPRVLHRVGHRRTCKRPRYVELTQGILKWLKHIFRRETSSSTKFSRPINTVYLFDSSTFFRNLKKTIILSYLITIFIFI